jgi:hypothetical protein
MYPILDFLVSYVLLPVLWYLMPVDGLDGFGGRDQLSEPPVPFESPLSLVLPWHSCLGSEWAAIVAKVEDSRHECCARRRLG